MSSQNSGAPIQVKRLARLLDELVAHLKQRLANAESTDEAVEVYRVALLNDAVISTVLYLREIGLAVDAARLKATYNRLFWKATNVWLSACTKGTSEAYQDEIEEMLGTYPRPSDDDTAYAEDEKNGLLVAHCEIRELLEHLIELRETLPVTLPPSQSPTAPGKPKADSDSNPGDGVDAGAAVDMLEGTAGEEDDSLPAKQRRVSPSRTKAKAAYDWAMSKIPGADDMTIVELYSAIECHPSNASECLPPTAESFGRYLNDAGVKRYTKVSKATGGSVRHADDL